MRLTGRRSRPGAPLGSADVEMGKVAAARAAAEALGIQITAMLAPGVEAILTPNPVYFLSDSLHKIYLRQRQDGVKFSTSATRRR